MAIDGNDDSWFRMVMNGHEWSYPPVSSHIAIGRPSKTQTTGGSCLVMPGLVIDDRLRPARHTVPGDLKVIFSYIFPPAIEPKSDIDSKCRTHHRNSKVRQSWIDRSRKAGTLCPIGTDG